MKTNLLIIALLIACISQLNSQTLSDIYKKENIELQPVGDFNINNNLTGNTTAEYKRIVVAKDGSVFMSQRNKYEILKFDKNGNLVKKIGSRGSKPGQFVYVPGVEGFLDDKYLITSDHDGRINFFDLDGNYVKTIKLDYMPLSITPLKNGKFAVLGHTSIEKNNTSQIKHLMRIIDFNTSAQKQLWQEISDPIKNAVVMVIFPNYKGMMSSGLPYDYRVRMATTKSGNLIIASPKSGEVTVYNTDGNLVNTFKLNIIPIKITEEDMRKHYEKALKDEADYEKKYLYSSSSKWTDAERKEISASYKKQLENFKDPKFYPEYLPYFSSIIVDSDGNLLVFEYTNEEDKNTNKFTAFSYDMKGNFIGQSSFKSGTLDLSFNPATFQFYNGYVYVIAKNIEKSILQIGKLKLQ